MRNSITLLFLTIMVFGCSSKRKVERALTSGNYNEAIYKAVNRLKNNKDAKRKQDFILLLKDAYDKANTRDLNAIKGLEASKNPEYYQRIFETYNAMDQRQNAIIPLLPLKVKNREVYFDINDYTQEINVARENVSSHFYSKSQTLLNTEDKLQIRDAYDTLEYIEDINPNYQNTRNLMFEAHERGKSHVLVSIENRTNQIIPKRLENALLDFDTYGLNQFWTEFHSLEKDSLEFDYGMTLRLAQINISPEQVREREVLRQQEIRDGWQYVLDENGNVAKDSLGNDIKEDKFINVRARLFEVEQFKQSQITANLILVDYNNNEVIEQFNIDSGFVFENFYATFRGDRRALTADDITLINGGPIPFPYNEQMVFDSGEDLKLQLKELIADYRF